MGSQKKYPINWKKADKKKNEDKQVMVQIK